MARLPNVCSICHDPDTVAQDCQALQMEHRSWVPPFSGSRCNWWHYWKFRAYWRDLKQMFKKVNFHMFKVYGFDQKWLYVLAGSFHGIWQVLRSSSSRCSVGCVTCWTDLLQPSLHAGIVSFCMRRVHGRFDHCGRWFDLLTWLSDLFPGRSVVCVSVFSDIDVASSGPQRGFVSLRRVIRNRE